MKYDTNITQYICTKIYWYNIRNQKLFVVNVSFVGAINCYAINFFLFHSKFFFFVTQITWINYELCEIRDNSTELPDLRNDVLLEMIYTRFYFIKIKKRGLWFNLEFPNQQVVIVL